MVTPVVLGGLSGVIRVLGITMLVRMVVIIIIIWIVVTVRVLGVIIGVIFVGHGVEVWGNGLRYGMGLRVLAVELAIQYEHFLLFSDLRLL
jgi:hypothetical protein